MMDSKKVKKILKCFFQLILKFKSRSEGFKAYSVLIAAILAINTGYSWFIQKDQDGYRWGISDGSIGWPQVIITLILFIAFLTYRYYKNKEDYHKFILETTPKLSKEQINALKLIHDDLFQELNIIDECTLFILCRGGLSWYSYNNNNLLIPKSIKELESTVLNQRAFIDDNLFFSLKNHISIANKLTDSLFYLVATLSSADDQDAMTSVFDITYNQDIQVSAEFVKMMMDEFKKVDDHPAYDDYADIYKKVNTTGTELITIIKSKLVYKCNE